MTKFGIIGAVSVGVMGTTVIVVPTVIALTGRNVDARAKMIYENSIDELKEICTIPHTSNAEEVEADSDADHLKGIRNHIKNKVKKYMGNDCVIGQDKVGNIWFDIPASKGFENQKALIFQGHMDMVWHAVGEASKWNPLEHPVSEPVIETVNGRKIMHTKDWLTSLGADDGQGMAVMLSLAKYHDQFKHCPIRCLFTVDEETTTAGARNIGMDFTDFDYLTNLDSPHGGQIMTTSAGIGYYAHEITVPYEETAKETTLIHFSNFKGGHSGEDVDSPRVNPIFWACKEFADLCKNESLGIQLVSMASTVEKGNQIPTDVTIEIASNLPYTIWQKILSYDFEQIPLTYSLETDAKISVTKGTSKTVISEKNTSTIFQGIAMLPCGALNEMRFDDGFIGGSGNIAPFSWEKNINNYEVNFQTSYRFGSNAWGEEIDSMTNEAVSYISSHLEGGQYVINKTKTSPVWEDKPNNKLANLCADMHKKLKLDVEFAKCHGALEPGDFCEKKEDLTQIAIGPTVLNEHNNKEQLFLDEYLHTCEVLVQMVKNMNI